MRTFHRGLVVLVAVLAALLGQVPTASGAGPTVATVREAFAHRMRYHLALPAGWSASRDWPVLVVIPDAARDFEANLAGFVKARGNRPYILVSPEVLSGGGARSRTPDRFSYSPAVWDSLQHLDDFAFEDAGLAAVLADVHRLWRGEARAFLTGWEASGHTVWAQTFRHPERWRGVAPVTPNYAKRGVDDASVSRAPERTTLPIQVFRCGAPSGDGAIAAKFVDQQAVVAFRDAKNHGFQPRPVRIVPKVDHGPLPDVVLAWCDSLRAKH